VISPGGTGSFDANDLLTVADNSGTLTLQNDLNMSAGGSLQWSLGALSTSGPGANFDQLVVGGNLTLGGTSNLTLDFSQLAGTGPGSGNAFWNSPHSWTIVDTAGNNATTNFASLTNALFAGGQFTTAIVGGDIILNYSIGGLTPGDFNSDGQVNGVDFGIWQNSFPTTAGGTQATGDADGDGDIDGADFIIWQTHYPTPANPTTAVPEPSSLMLALASVASVILVRRRANQ
jgi:hypothetical protein